MLRIFYIVHLRQSVTTGNWPVTPGVFAVMQIYLPCWPNTCLPIEVVRSIIATVSPCAAARPPPPRCPPCRRSPRPSAAIAPPSHRHTAVDRASVVRRRL